MGWFCPRGHFSVSADILGRHNWGVRCFWDLADRSQGRCWTPCNTQATPLPLSMKNYLTPNVNSTKAGKPCSNSCLLSPGRLFEEAQVNSSFSICGKNFLNILNCLYRSTIVKKALRNKPCQYSLAGAATGGTGSEAVLTGTWGVIS